MTRVLGKLRLLWSRRRWLFAGYMLVAVARIPARTGFRLKAPACDMRPTLATAELSLTKLPHMVLFGIFFLLTAVQFAQVDRKTVSWGFLATVALGVLIELEEGATRTGNCRMTDVLPDLVGAIVAMALVMAVLLIRSRLGEASTTRARR
jgi:VanZ family protein